MPGGIAPIFVCHWFSKQVNRRHWNVEVVDGRIIRRRNVIVMSALSQTTKEHVADVWHSKLEALCAITTGIVADVERRSVQS